jgi:LacI family transcriptional regulator
MRGHTDKSPAIKERVLCRVQELGYSPNLAARSLVTGRTYTVGAVGPDLKHPFFAEIAAGVACRIRRKSYGVAIATSVGSMVVPRGLEPQTSTAPKSACP